MGDNEIYSKKWCDLIFKHRNKKYGAYVLRAQTGHRYRVALTVIISIFLFISVPPLVVLILTRQPQQQVDPVKKMARFDGLRIKEARPPRREPHKSQPKLAKKVKNLKEQKETEKEVATIFHPQDMTIDPEKIKDLPIDSIETLRKEAKLDLAKSTEQTDGVILDSIPRYPTGLMAFMRWLNQNMVYPPDCVRRHIAGTVEVAFIVEPNGKISDPRILKSAGPQLNHEVLRVISLMPKWIPAQKYGRAIRSQVTLPVVFEMSE
ncbi:MAG: TonB family protein [Bacteroidaceae bacterium]|jgi:protein TonB|nr:TonB family protein [Bacteroidaceae bacterium]